MRFVPVKTAGNQAALMLIGMRDRLVRNRTQLANAIHGYAAEFGLSAAKGTSKVGSLLERIAADGAHQITHEGCERCIAEVKLAPKLFGLFRILRSSPRGDEPPLRRSGLLIDWKKCDT